jgi:hypothetical protein
MTRTNIGRKRCWVAAGLAVAVTFWSIGVPSIAAAERAVRAEKNPLGDIPDNQVFVSYASPLGFLLQVPEGWSRMDRPDGVRFFDKYNIIDIAVARSAAAPGAGSARARETAGLIASGHAVKIASIRNVRLKGGPAVQIVYTSDSEPNQVTGKRIRLEHERFIFLRGARP